jgi:dihydroneopterin aldolase
MRTDKIIIDGIEFYGYHGDLPEERELGQRYSVDMELILDSRPSGLSDRIEETIDYASVVKRVHEIGSSEQYHLIEALAERIAVVILDEFSPLEVRVRVTKTHPPISTPVRNVGIEITRRQS